MDDFEVLESDRFKGELEEVILWLYSHNLEQSQEFADQKYFEYKDAANKTALLVNITPANLSRFLTKELDVSVVNNTGLSTGNRLKVEMDFASLASARESLARHGLALERIKEGATVVARLR